MGLFVEGITNATRRRRPGGLTRMIHQGNSFKDIPRTRVYCTQSFCRVFGNLETPSERPTLCAGFDYMTFEYKNTFVSYTRAPLSGPLTPPATLAQQGMQPKHAKGAGIRRPCIWCQHRLYNATSCLCTANCHVLCCVLVGGVTF